MKIFGHEVTGLGVASSVAPAPDAVDRALAALSGADRCYQAVLITLTRSSTPVPPRFGLMPEGTAGAYIHITLTSDDLLSAVSRDVIRGRTVYIRAEPGRESDVVTLMERLEDDLPAAAYYPCRYGLWVYDSERDDGDHWSLCEFGEGVDTAALQGLHSRLA